MLVIGNVVYAKHAFQAQPAPQPQPAATPLQAVDFAELDRVTHHVAWLHESSKVSRFAVFFRHPKTKKFSSATMAEFLERGLPFLQRGMKSLLKEKDYATRLNGLQRLEAMYYLIACDGITHFENLAEEKIAAQRKLIAANIDHHTAPEGFISRWREQYLPYI